nr:hypothetical protein [Micromonospora sp. DSM 115978]
YSGTLYGTLSAGGGSCAAEVVTTDQAYGGGPAVVSLEAANYTKEDSEPPSFFYVGYYKFSVQICIWSLADPGAKRCSPSFVNTQGNVARG